MSKEEYIERKVAIIELECLPDQGELDYLGVFDCIRNVPTADVEPVVHGEWIDTGYETLFSKEVKCSNCGKAQLGETPYCPNCGARMDGGK